MVWLMNCAWSPHENRMVYPMNDLMAESTRLLCPNPACRVPVVLVHRYPKFYFAHQRAQANPDCENYSATVAASGNRPDLVDHPLYLAIYEDERPPWSWELQLHLRWPLEGETGTLDIAGWHGLRVFPQGSLPQRFRVLPETTYVATVRSGQTSVPIELDGLQPNHISLFRFSPHGGRLIEDRTPMVWGEPYGVLWPIELPVLGIPSELNPQWLKATDGWKGAWIQLPPSPCLAVEQWMKRYRRGGIHSRGASLRVVYPPLLGRDVFSVTVGDVVIIEVDNVGSEPIKVWVESVRERQVLSATEFPSSWWLRFDQEGIHRVFIPNANTVIDIDVLSEDASKFHEYDFPSVALRFECRGDGRYGRLDYPGLDKLFVEVAKGALEIREVRMPPGFHLDLLTLDSQRIWVRESYESNRSNLLLDRMVHLLKIGQPFQVDGGELGSVQFEVGVHRSIEVHKMSASWRARARWLATVGGSTPDAVFRTQIKSVLPRVSIADQRVLKDIAAAYRRDLEPFYRQLLRELLSEVSNDRGVE